MEGDGPAQSYRRNRASPRSGRRRASSVTTGGASPRSGRRRASSVLGVSQKWKETGQLSPYKQSLSKKWKETGQLSPYRTEPLQEVEGDGPAQSLQPQPSLSRRASSVLTGGTEPLQEVEGDGSSVPTGGTESLQSEPSLYKKWKEEGQLIPYSPYRASPRSGRRRASSVPTAPTEPLQEVEGDGPAQSLQAEPSLSKKWKETGQLSHYRRNRASPRSGRRRASSVPTAPTEPLQEVEGDGPAQSLQAEPSLYKKWKETGQLSPCRPKRASPRSGRRRASSVPTAPPDPSKKWKETGQLTPYRLNRASLRSGRRRASSVLTGGAEPLQEVEGDGPAQSLQPQQILSQKWKETVQLSPYSPNRASPRSGRRRASSVPLAPTEPFPEVEGDRPAQSLQPQQSLSKKWKETGQLSPYRRSRESPRSGRRRASSVPTAPTEPLQEVEGDGPAQPLQAEPSLSQKWRETGQLSPSSPNRAFPRSGRRPSSSVPTAPTEPLQEVEGDGPAQSLQAEPRISQKWKETGQVSPYRRNRASPRSGRRRASSVLTVGTKPPQEVEGDVPAQPLQAQKSLSKKWKETGQLSHYRRNRASPRSGRRRASSVPLAPTEPFPEVEGDRPAQSLQPQQSLSKKWKETGQLSLYRRSRESPRSGRRRACSVPTAPTEPLQEVEGDGPAQSLQAEPSLSKKWKETGQLSHYRRNRASPRSGRRRASSVPTAPTEPFQEVEGDGPAQSLQAEPSLYKKWKETGQLSPYSPNRASPRSGRRRARSVPTAPPDPSKKWKETGQLSPYRLNRASLRSERRRASSVLTGGAEGLQEVEGDGPAQSLQPQQSLSQKWKETVQLSPYSPNRASPRSGKRRASSVLTGGAENLQEVEGDGPAQSLQAEPSLSKKWKETGQLSPYRRNRASPRSGRRRASSVPLAPTEPFPEVEGDRPAQSLQPQQSLSKKWKETGQLSPHRRSRESPRSGRRRASSVPTAPTEPLQEVEGDGPAQTLQAEPSLSQKWRETGQLSPSSPNRAFPGSGRRPSSSVPTAPTEPLQEVEGDGPAQSLQAEPRISQKWKETGQASPYRRNRASPRSGRRRASSVLTVGTKPPQEVEGDGPAQSLQAQKSLSKKWKETGQLSPYSPNRASPRSGRRRASSVLTGGTEPLQEVEGDGQAQSLQDEPSLSQKWKQTGQLSPYSPTRPLQEVEGDGPAQSLQAEPSLSQKWKETGKLSPYGRSRASPRSGRRRASSVPTAPTEPQTEVDGDRPAQSLQPQ